MRSYETDRLILRPWTEKDLKPFFKINTDPLVLEFLPKALTRIESDTFVRRAQESFQRHGVGLWALEVKDSGKFIGSTGLSIPSFEAAFTPCKEVSWRLASDHWGFGYATEAAKKVIELGFGEFHLPEILSFTVPENQRSIRVMEKIGMVRHPVYDFAHPMLPPDHPLSWHVVYSHQAH